MALPSNADQAVLETLNTALRQTSGHFRAADLPKELPLCGQIVKVEVPVIESAEAISTLRQMLLREINKEIKTFHAENYSDAQKDNLGGDRKQEL